MFVSAETSTDAFLHIQDFARNASVIDRKIGFGTYLDGQAFSIGGTYLGTLDDFNNKVRLLRLVYSGMELMRIGQIAPELLRGLPTPSSKSVQAVDWIKSLTLLAGQSLQQPVTNYNAHDNFVSAHHIFCRQI